MPSLNLQLHFYIHTWFGLARGRKKKKKVQNKFKNLAHLWKTGFISIIVACNFSKSQLGLDSIECFHATLSPSNHLRIACAHAGQCASIIKW